MHRPAHNPRAARALPFWVKVPYTLFVCTLVPVYGVAYGPSNFLWSSDLALLLAVPALWLEQRLLASMLALAVLLPDLVWNVDFFTRLIAGRDVIGLDATGYMFQPQIPRWLRALSLFHVFLPVLSAWMVVRLGYDRRAWVAQTLLAWLVMALCYGLGDRQRNINWVFGLGSQPQPWLPPLLYLAVWMLAVALLVYLPTHLVLRRWCPTRRG